MPGTLLLLLAVMLLSGIKAVRAQDLVTSLAYWEEDRCRPVALAELPLDRFKPYNGLLARGYGPCAIWVRVRIDPASARDALPDAAARRRSSMATTSASPARLLDETLLLRMIPSYLDRIELYDPLSRSTAPAITGDRYDPDLSGYRSQALHFLIARGDAPRDLFLRLKTESTRLLHVQALPFAQGVERDRIEELFHAAYLTLLMGSLLIAAVQWLNSRERLIGVFVAKQIVVIVWALLVLGYGRLVSASIIAPATFDAMTSVAVLGYAATSIVFDRALLWEIGQRRGQWLLLVFVALFPLELLLLVFGQAWLALSINAAVAAVGSALIFVLMASAPAADVDEAPLLPRYLLVIFYGSICALVLSAMLPLLGAGQGGIAMLNVQIAHGLLTGVVMLALLIVRARRLARRQAATVAELELARGLMEQQRLHGEEQDKLLSMLTHELKTPISAMRMVLGTGQSAQWQQAHIQRALDDMNDVVERCTQAGLLAGDRLEARLEPLNLRAELEAMASDEPHARSVPFALEVDDSARLRGQEGTIIQTDPLLLRIILNNLLDNARKYGVGESGISVRLERGSRTGFPQRDGLSVIVANSPGAAGWPDPDRIFQKYYRSPSAHRQTGSGLGLHLVAGLAKLIGGQVSYEPTAAQVRFRLWLPL